MPKKLGVDTKMNLAVLQVMSKYRFFHLAWRPSFILAQGIALNFYIFHEFLMHRNLHVDTKINILGAFTENL